MTREEAKQLIEEINRMHKMHEEELRKMQKELTALRLLFEDAFPDRHEPV